MTNIPNDITVVDNQVAHRYEAQVNGYVAFAAYEQHHSDEITFTHTEVPPELGGGGVGSRIAQFALDDARARQLRVIPLCPFIAAYIKRHAEYRDLVPAAYQDRVS
jgi:predicted GNAT family acetyltransferase